MTSLRCSLRSDNHLWVPLLANAVVSELGELSLLDQGVPFLAEDLESSAGEGTVWEHLMRGMRFTDANLGSHGIPLIFRSDWNDHFGMFGVEGRDEGCKVVEEDPGVSAAISAIRELEGFVHGVEEESEFRVYYSEKYGHRLNFTSRRFWETHLW